MPENRPIGHDSPAVRTHVEMMQGVINRMAENSRSCKVWCVILVAAVLVLVAGTGEPQHALIALAPTALFFVLDAYYLALERAFRRSYNAFVGKVHSGQVSTSDLYTVAPSGAIPGGTLWAMFKSVAVPPFYLGVAATIVLAWLLIL